MWFCALDWLCPSQAPSYQANLSTAQQTGGTTPRSQPSKKRSALIPQKHTVTLGTGHRVAKHPRQYHKRRLLVPIMATALSSSNSNQVSAQSLLPLLRSYHPHLHLHHPLHLHSLHPLSSTPSTTPTPAPSTLGSSPLGEYECGSLQSRLTSGDLRLRNACCNTKDFLDLVIPKAEQQALSPTHSREIAGDRPPLWGGEAPGSRGSPLPARQGNPFLRGCPFQNPGVNKIKKVFYLLTQVEYTKPTQH